MKTLNTQLLSRFLELASRRLKGEWLLMGGTLLPAVGLNIRSTVDIDVVGLGEAENAQSLVLMEIAEELELPVESINQAAAYFLKKVGYKKTDLLPLTQGKEATIYRPSADLYLRLKAGRLSETDLVDCQHYFNYCISRGDAIDLKKINRWLRPMIENESSSLKVARLKSLEEYLNRP